MKNKEYFKIELHPVVHSRKWFNIILAVAVIVATFNILRMLPSLKGDTMWWMGAIVFLWAVFLLGAYEITIKGGLQRGLPKGTIALEILFVWVLPVILGYFIESFLPHI